MTPVSVMPTRASPSRKHSGPGSRPLAFLRSRLFSLKTRPMRRRIRQYAYGGIAAVAAPFRRTADTAEGDLAVDEAKLDEFMAAFVHDLASSCAQPPSC
jgi:hypothetical protein